MEITDIVDTCCFVQKQINSNLESFSYSNDHNSSGDYS